MGPGGEKTVSQSSANRKQDNLPVHLNNQSGFGNGYRFHYNQQTHQSEWSNKKYNKFYHEFHDSRTEGQDVHEKLPDFVVPPPANDETSLPPGERLAFATEVSISYHKRRHTHYDSAYRLIMMSIILLTAFAFTSGVDSRSILGLSIIGLAAGSVLWNITGLSRVHDVLCSEYQHLLELIRHTATPEERDIRNWRSVRMRIRSKEPPVFWAVANECYYDVAHAWHLEPKKREQLPLMLRPFRNWFRF